MTENIVKGVCRDIWEDPLRDNTLTAKDVKKNTPLSAKEAGQRLMTMDIVQKWGTGTSDGTRWVIVEEP